MTASAEAATGAPLDSVEASARERGQADLDHVELIPPDSAIDDLILARLGIEDPLVGRFILDQRYGQRPVVVAELQCLASVTV